MEKLIVLCVPLSGAGHVNPMIAVATALQKRGHRIVFATEYSWKGKLAKLGFEEAIYDERERSQEQTLSSQKWAENIASKVTELKKPPIERTSPGAFDKFFDAVKYSHERMLSIVKDVKPDIIIEDLLVFMPALLSANVAIIKLYSMNPLYAFGSEKLPNCRTGLPLNDTTDWEHHNQIISKLMFDCSNKINKWTKAQHPDAPDQMLTKSYTSTNLNIYVYPKAAVADYLRHCHLGPEWIGLDHCMRQSPGTFKLPPRLNNGSGKLVFISLGTLGSAIVELMQRLTSMLSKSKHRFIVVKGISHDKYELPENMWGESFLPQLDILPQVNLVLTHGGNNTFVESLYFGKPMIVFPLFGDQFANAQRAVEMKIGHRFDPFTVTEKELYDAIDFLLYDEEVNKKLAEISVQMKGSKSMDEAVEKIEFVAKNAKFPTVI